MVLKATESHTVFGTAMEAPPPIRLVPSSPTQVDEYNAVRLKLTAEMADSSQLVKALVIKAEDARILNDMKLMKKMYSSLYDVNRSPPPCPFPCLNQPLVAHAQGPLCFENTHKGVFL